MKKKKKTSPEMKKRISGMAEEMAASVFKKGKKKLAS